MLEHFGPVFAAVVFIGLAVAFVTSLWRASKRPDNPKKDDQDPGDNSVSHGGSVLGGGGDFG